MSKAWWFAAAGLACTALSNPFCVGVRAQNESTVDLPTSKQLILPVPGSPQRINSLPMTLAVSPDGRWVASINAGYGTLESKYEQSITVLDTQNGQVHDFPDARTLVESKQTYYSGLAFSADGQEVYASMASLSDAEGKGKGHTGSGIAVFRFNNGAITQGRFIKLPPVLLAAGRKTLLPTASSPSMGVAYPAAIAVVPSSGGNRMLLVAENLSDSVALVNVTSGKVEKSFDLSLAESVPSSYPVGLAVTADGRRAFVALWNASEIAELDLSRGTVAARVPLLKPRLATAAGSHPCALLLDEKGGTLYVALSNRDAVAVLSIGKTLSSASIRGYFDTRLPGQSYFGAEPDALAKTSDGRYIFAANMGTNSVAVLNPKKLRSMAKARGATQPEGFVPTELMPTGLEFTGNKLYVATAKGKGTGPNAKTQVVTQETRDMARFHRTFTYAPTLLYGSLAAIDESALQADLGKLTQQCIAANRERAAAESLHFAHGANRIRHVIYIIRENRTYDQVLGDLAADGHRVGNGDPSLTMYGADTTPNLHKLALQFGVLDNFFDSGEVSGDGHVWSNAGIGTDYLEKTWQQNYRGGERPYDYEGMVADGYPLLQHIADVVEPSSGYLWTNLAAHGKSLYHFGEYISTTFCNDKKMNIAVASQEGAMNTERAACASPLIRPGEAIPEEWGGGINRWPWGIPRIARNVATKKELEGHFAPEAPDFNLNVPDQIRVAIFLRHLEQWKKDRAAGRDSMPSFIMLRLPNDHTAGTTPGAPTPKSSIADNDLALGKAVEAISHSAFWDDTAFFVLEDDAQGGGDHVDAHRSLGLVISKYSPHAKSGEGAFVDSRFYTTVSMVRTMEVALGLPPMNNNDAFAPIIGSLFTGPGDQPAFVADASNMQNGLIYRANAASAPGASLSGRMDFRHADRADAATLNAILWKDAMGDKPMPPMPKNKRGRTKDDDD